MPELTATAALFRAFAHALDLDPSHEGFDHELAALPGAYGSPGGEILLAKRADHVLGCIALKPSAPGVAEIGRLFVREQMRGIGVGTALVGAVTDTARGLGYGEIGLDLPPRRQDVAAFFQLCGFAPVTHCRSGIMRMARRLRLP